MTYPEAPNSPTPPQNAGPQHLAPQYAPAQYAQPQYAQSPYAPPQNAQPQYAQQPFAPPVFSFVPPGPGEPYNGAAHPSDVIRPLYGASFPQAIRRFFASYVRFTGRASRSEFWWSFLFCGLLRVLPFFALGIFAIATEELPSSAMSSQAEEAVAALGGLTIIVVYLGLLLPQLAVAARRLHDGNYSALLLLLILIPWIGTIVIGVFMLLESRPAGRRFDSDPMPAFAPVAPHAPAPTWPPHPGQ